MERDPARCFPPAGIWGRGMVFDEQRQDKLSARAYKYIFTGFHDAANAIRYFDAATRRIKVSHNFKFLAPSPPDTVATVPLAPKGEIHLTSAHWKHPIWEQCP